MNDQSYDHKSTFKSVISAIRLTWIRVSGIYARNIDVSLYRSSKLYRLKTHYRDKINS